MMGIYLHALSTRDNTQHDPPVLSTTESKTFHTGMFLGKRPL